VNGKTTLYQDGLWITETLVMCACGMGAITLTDPDSNCSNCGQLWRTLKPDLMERVRACISQQEQSDQAKARLEAIIQAGIVVDSPFNVE
jgi:hypothetical protein